MNLIKYNINNNLSNIHKLLQCSNVVKEDKNLRKVVYLNNCNNDIQKLKNLLYKIGCFEFYSTNSGNKIIGLSQINYFLYSGYKAYANGYKVDGSIHEVHHIDGNVRNNSSQNLILLSSFDHHLVTSFQRVNIKSLSNFDINNLKHFYSSKYNDNTSTPFNNQGKKIKNHQHFILNIIAKTIKATSQSEWLKKAIQRNISIAEINKLVEKFNPEKYSPYFYKDELLKDVIYSQEQMFKQAESLIFSTY